MYYYFFYMGHIYSKRVDDMKTWIEYGYRMLIFMTDLFFIIKRNHQKIHCY